MWRFKSKRLGILALVASILGSVFSAPTAEALFKVQPATHWGYIYAGNPTTAKPSSRPKSANFVAKSKFDVKYNNFPDWAKKEVQGAIDIWSANFKSSVPVTIDASWGRSASWGILGSARPVSFYSGFSGAPDPSLWYPSALANALAGKDLDKANPEIIIQVNSNAQWNARGDGAPNNSEYDLQSVFIHEIAHGLAFLANDSYDTYFGIGSIDQPTPFDAYAQTVDGRRLADIPSPSLELGKVLTTSLVWAGPLGIAANGGIKPKLYTPARYESGSSISHLDEATFSKLGQDSIMTPNLDAGEIFTGPGPLLLAMMEDMRNKPPAGIATGLPEVPRNAQAFIGDSSSLISFDPPINLRSAQISDYVIKNIKTGVEKKSLTSPVTMTGLKNGTSYTFSIVARNALGTSAPIITKPVTPQVGWKNSVLDGSADGASVVSTTFNGLPVIVYTDKKRGLLKLATYSGSAWKKVTVDGAGGSSGRTSNPISSHLSICVNGSGKRQALHIFYSDSKYKDLRYATFNGKAFSFEIVDGNGDAVNDYSEAVRVRTSSDVSVSNACVASSAGVQVFYRDETQGILLGAVKLKSSKWKYELIDGDRKTDERTTGDVAFHLQAIFNGSQTYIIYDSVISLNSKKEMNAGAVRIATRISTSPSDWRYRTLDLSTDSANVFGYDVALSKIGGDVMATWLSASLASLPKPDQIRWANLSTPTKISSMTTQNFGTPGEFLSTNGTTIIFNCQDRLCALDTTKKDSAENAIRLVRSTQGSGPTQSAWVLVNKVKYLLATVNGKLALLKP